MAVNVENFKKLLDFLKAEDDMNGLYRFDMSTWIDADSEATVTHEDDALVHLIELPLHRDEAGYSFACETIACLGGTASMLMALEKAEEFFANNPNSKAVPMVVTSRSDEVHTEEGGWLGIDWHDVDWLFYGGVVPLRYIGKDDAIKMLEHIIEFECLPVDGWLTVIPDIEQRMREDPVGYLINEWVE